MNFLLDQRIAPKWFGLTLTQRSDWHLFASANPITNNKGQLVAINGWQMFVHVNCWLAQTTPEVMLTDPPTALSRPSTFNVAVTTWKIKSRLAAGTTARRGRVFMTVTPAIPAQRVVFFMQHKTRFGEFLGKTQLHRRPRLTYLNAGETGFVNLTANRGYRNFFHAFGEKVKIFGHFATTHPTYAAGRTVICSTVNGMRVDGTMTNSNA